MRFVPRLSRLDVVKLRSEHLTGSVAGTAEPGDCSSPTVDNKGPAFLKPVPLNVSVRTRRRRRLGRTRVGLRRHSFLKFIYSILFSNRAVRKKVRDAAGRAKSL